MIFFNGFTGWSSSGYAYTIGTLRVSSLVHGLDWDALFIWDISWFTCVSFSWATYLTGILGSTAGALAFLNISYRVMNESLCPFPSFTSGLAGDGFCSA